MHALIRFEGAAEQHAATIGFEDGWSRPGEMVHARVWLRSPELALDVVPTRRFDVLQDGKLIATGEVLAGG
jgi:hypothetical protein